MFVRTFYGFVSWIKILFCIELKDRLSSFFFARCHCIIIISITLFMQFYVIYYLNTT